MYSEILYFAFYRFITGLGVGGEFAVGVALLAEVMPAKARSGALGSLQALSAVGNISAALIGMGMANLEKSGTIALGNSWRWMFVIGAIPAFLAATKLDPDFGRGYSSAATAASNLGRREDADEYYKQALARIDRMTEREKFRTRGQYYLFSRNAPRAIEEFTSARKLA